MAVVLGVVGAGVGAAYQAVGEVIAECGGNAVYCLGGAVGVFVFKVLI